MQDKLIQDLKNFSDIVSTYNIVDKQQKIIDIAKNIREKVYSLSESEFQKFLTSLQTEQIQIEVEDIVNKDKLKTISLPLKNLLIASFLYPESLDDNFSSLDKRQIYLDKLINN